MSEPFQPADLGGLTSEEVLERVAREGYNELPQTRKRGILHIVLEVFREPMFLLLVACGLLYLILGDPGEALMLLGFVAVIIGITVYQEGKTERALDALRDLSSPRALVVRDGEQRRIPGREVVRDDIILLAEGDRVPADARVLHQVNLSADESLLTGESVPVGKATWDGTSEPVRPGGDGQSMVYSGSMIVRGQGVARVTATGIRTEMGKIGKALQSLEPGQTRLQSETGRIVRSFAFAGFILCAVVVLVFGFTRGDWLRGVLAGLSLAMATLPEEFPVVLTVFLALGAWRISRRSVLTRRMPAVETLGSATVLCTDKTGTLTLNRMTVTTLCVGSRIHRIGNADDRLPEDYHELVEHALLASPRDPFDPMEKAMRELGSRTLLNTEHLREDWNLLREYPLSERLLAMSRVWESASGEGLIVAAKGAPEAIADLCHLDGTSAAGIRGCVDRLASEGLRVIAVGSARVPPGGLPEGQHDFPFKFLGLLGLQDPIRPQVPDAVALCRRAGIRVLMITGDYPGTASNIARAAGIENPGDVLTGPEIETLDPGELRVRLARVNVIARAVPEQKLRIVEALKANGEVVAMTGDGVNDAPALKAADIGVAMGGRGTDVAREAADIVLLDDDFASIVQAVRTGRRIYDNLRKAIAFILAVHLPIAGMALLPVLAGWPLALLPVHILFLELIIDPACSVVFEMEDEEEDVMDRPPRKATERLFGRHLVVLAVVQGLAVLALVAGVYAWSLASGFGEGEARALSFVGLVFGNLGMIISNRSRTQGFFRILARPNPAQTWVVAGALVFLAAAVFVPALNGVFGFAPVHLWQIPFSLATGVVAAGAAESVKLPDLLRARGSIRKRSNG